MRWKTPIHLNALTAGPISFSTSKNSMAELAVPVTTRFATRLIFAWLLIASPSRAAGLPGKWEIRALMPTARTEVGAVDLDGQIYVMGGYEKNGDRVEAYDPMQNNWRGRAALPRALHHLGAASVAGKIFVFGGESNLGTHNQAESSDPVNNSWQGWAPMPTARHGLGAAIVGSSIYVISGGPKPGATFSSVNEVFTPIQ